MDWFTGTYLGVKMIHPRVSRSVRTQVKTSDTGYIQDSHYTIICQVKTLDTGYIQDSRYTIICQNPGSHPSS